MNRKLFTLVLLLAVAGCSWFDKKENPPLKGERHDVLPFADQGVDASSATPKLDAANLVTSWTQENGSAAQMGVHADFTPKFSEVWRTAIGDGEGDRMVFTARPVGADGKIFVMDVHGHITALEATTGKKLWRVSTRKNHNNALAGGLALAAGKLFATNGLTQLLAINTDNGALIWQVELDAPARAAPVAADGKVYAFTRADQIFALDAATGKILWQHHGLQENAGVLAGAAPAADGDMVVVSYASGETVALTPGNGSVLWNDNLSVGRPQNNLATLHDSRAPPMLLKDTVIAATFAANTSAIERRLGDRVWGQNFGALQPMTASGDAVFLISTNAQLMALAQSDGSKFWSKPLPPPKKPDEDLDMKQQYWFGPLLLNDQLLVVSADGTVQLRDIKTGDVVTEIKDLPAPAENPIVLQHMIYWVTMGGDIVAYQ